MNPADLNKLLLSERLPLENEKETQRVLGSRLEEHGIPFEREVRLLAVGFWEGEIDDLGSIDFLVEGTIGIELKLKGSAPDVLRQVTRYARDRRLTHITVLTVRPLRLPGFVGGATMSVVPLGSAWL